MKKFKNRRQSLKDENTSLPFSKVFVRCLAITGIFLLISPIITVFVSLLFYNLSDPLPNAKTAGIISLYISLVICGFILSKINSQKYVIGGLTLGLIFLCMFFLLSTIINIHQENNGILIKSLIPFVTITGSILGIKRNKIKRHKHKKYN